MLVEEIGHQLVRLRIAETMALSLHYVKGGLYPLVLQRVVEYLALAEETLCSVRDACDQAFFRARMMMSIARPGISVPVNARPGHLMSSVNFCGMNGTQLPVCLTMENPH
jgi:hypothetical protein